MLTEFFLKKKIISSKTKSFSCYTALNGDLIADFFLSRWEGLKEEQRKIN